MQGELFEEEPPEYSIEYEDYMNAFKTALFFQEWIEERDEEYLLEKYDIRPGEVHAKLDRIEWVLFSAQELCRITQKHDLLKDILKLRIRLKYGAREELLSLLRLKNIGRIRARALYAKGITDIRAVKAADDEVLKQLLGQSLAKDVKKQVGEKPEKRQESLEDYAELLSGSINAARNDRS